MYWKLKEEKSPYENWVKANKTPDEYPIGTKFKACGIGYWIKTKIGYEWYIGSTFFKLGDDYVGLICLPK